MSVSMDSGKRADLTELVGLAVSSLTLSKVPKIWGYEGEVYISFGEDDNNLPVSNGMVWLYTSIASDSFEGYNITALVHKSYKKEGITEELLLAEYNYMIAEVRRKYALISSTLLKTPTKFPLRKGSQ